MVANHHQGVAAIDHGAYLLQHRRRLRAFVDQIAYEYGTVAVLIIMFAIVLITQLLQQAIQFGHVAVYVANNVKNGAVAVVHKESPGWQPLCRCDAT